MKFPRVPVTTIAVLVALFTTILAARAETHIELETATRNYLEGSWAIVDRATGDACDPQGQSYGDWQMYDIEFRRTGGSVWVTDQVDGDDRAWMGSARKNGQTIHLVLPGYKEIFFIPLNRNRMHVRESIGGMPTTFVEGIAHRCRTPRFEHIAALPARLAIHWTYRSPGGPHFVPARPGVTAEDACHSPYRGASGVLEFELIGPVSFWLVEWRNEHYDRRWTILSTRYETNGTVRFRMDAGSATPSLTIVPHGDRIGIPELSTEYIRCTTPQ